jgi:general secretion pathway protein G
MCCKGRQLERDARPQGRAGFSLPELMVVIVIIGLMAGVATVSVRSYLVRGKQNIAKMEIAKICEALDTFYAHNDRYPTSEEGIAVLAAKTADFPDGLLSKVPNDPWGNPYEYVVPGTNGPYEVVCYGGDHKQGGTGGDADISSADLGVDRNKSLAQLPSGNATR